MSGITPLQRRVYVDGGYMPSKCFRIEDYYILTNTPTEIHHFFVNDVFFDAWQISGFRRNCVYVKHLKELYVFRSNRRVFLPVIELIYNPLIKTYPDIDRKKVFEWLNQVPEIGAEVLAVIL